MSVLGSYGRGLQSVSGILATQASKTVLAGLKAQISLILGLIWLSSMLYEDWNRVNMKEIGNKMQRELGELGGWLTATLTP